MHLQEEVPAIQMGCFPRILEKTRRVQRSVVRNLERTLSKRRKDDGKMISTSVDELMEKEDAVTLRNEREAVLPLSDSPPAATMSELSYEPVPDAEIEVAKSRQVHDAVDNSPPLQIRPPPEIYLSEITVEDARAIMSSLLRSMTHPHVFEAEVEQETRGFSTSEEIIYSKGMDHECASAVTQLPVIKGNNIIIIEVNGDVKLAISRNIFPSFIFHLWYPFPENINPEFRISRSSTPDEWRRADVLLLKKKDFVSLPEVLPDCPNLMFLFLEENIDLTYIPPSFFLHMPALCFLDLSSTRIMTLPDSLFTLTKLQVLMLRSCFCIDTLPAQVKSLTSIQVLDLSDTELYSLPDEIGELIELKHLQISFYGPDDTREYAHLPQQLVSENFISKLQKLESLSIVVHPEDHRWTKIAERVIHYVAGLNMLGYLQIYFPTVEIFENFIMRSRAWHEGTLWKFKFVVGHDVRRVISRVPHEVETKYDQQNRCLRFVNGNQVPVMMANILARSTAAFCLDHHLNVESLSEFGISNSKELQFCVVRECPNLKFMIIDKETSTGTGSAIFPNLEHLGVYYLWALEQLCYDPVPMRSFQALKYLTVDTCPKLEYIVTKSMLECLSNLEEMVVESCESLRAILKENEIVKNDAKKFLPRLRKLVLRHLHLLVTLVNGLSIPKEKIISHWCPALTLDEKVKKRKFLRFL